ncbi:hypothetical protein ARTHRO8AJ_80002 [Arthrobacter sp. 8AJ]|nr:hypothetical protein ARTHRO8AJ_80002 [Arthrobacter sp. 8AJ]
MFAFSVNPFSAGLRRSEPPEAPPPWRTPAELVISNALVSDAALSGRDTQLRMVIQATGTSINLLVSMLSSQVGVAALFVGHQAACAGWTGAR